MFEPEAAPHDEKLAVTPFALADDVCGVAVDGAADLYGAPALGVAVGAALDGGCRRLLVDLSGATFIDSSCVGTLLGARRRMRERAGAVAVVCAEPRIARIFELTELDRVFLLCSDRAEAVARLRASAAEPSQEPGQDAPTTVAPLAFDTAGPSAEVADEIRLEVPAEPSLATVARLVLGGVASRFELPVDRMLELQLAFDAVAAHEAAGPSVEVIVEGRLRPPAGAHRALHGRPHGRCRHAACGRPGWWRTH
jgi:anti-sigma B factor antagonist